MKRRDFIKLGGVGTLAATGLLVPLGGRLSAKAASTLADADFPRPYTLPFRRPSVLAPYGTRPDGTLLYSVTARREDARILPRLTTPIHGYNGQFPGPTIDVEQGTRIALRVRNGLPAVNPIESQNFSTSTHLHGSASLPQFDGYADDLTWPGQAKVYEYPNFQDARTLWYHDHGVHRTAQNVYAGLAATYQMHDPLERGQLPQGPFDVPLVISDAMFAADGRLGYDDRDHSGLWGDVILVNGVPWPVMNVKRRVYRFRVLNASISRSYRVALSTGEALTVVATDGGLMSVPQPVASFRHSSAERYEVLIDFSKYAPGTVLHLVNRSNPNNINYTHTGKIMRFVVSDAAFDGTNNLVPTALDTGDRARDTMALTPDMASATRQLRVHRDDRTNIWQLNGKTWDDVVESGHTSIFSKPGVGEVELWEIENRGGGWFHPLHVHLVDFQVVWRNTNGGQPFAWERGPKDVVYIGEDEKVRLLMRFDVTQGSSGGRYMIHCHNLAHEDHDMMWQYQVGDSDPKADANDPILAAPAGADKDAPDDPSYDPPAALLGW